MLLWEIHSTLMMINKDKKYKENYNRTFLLNTSNHIKIFKGRAKWYLFRPQIQVISDFPSIRQFIKDKVNLSFFLRKLKNKKKMMKKNRKQKKISKISIKIRSLKKSLVKKNFKNKIKKRNPLKRKKRLVTRITLKTKNQLINCLNREKTISADLRIS